MYVWVVPTYQVRAEDEVGVGMLCFVSCWQRSICGLILIGNSSNIYLKVFCVLHSQVLSNVYSGHIKKRKVMFCSDPDYCSYLSSAFVFDAISLSYLEI